MKYGKKKCIRIKRVIVVGATVGDSYFSEREFGRPEPTLDHVTENAWKGIVTLIERRLRDGSFAQSFPVPCPDAERGAVYKCDQDMFWQAVEGEIPELALPIDTRTVPPTHVVMDFVEFCYKHVARPIQVHYHRFYGHYHLEFDTRDGRNQFREEINRLFSRNRMAFTMREDGRIERVAPTPLGTIYTAGYHTGDEQLDQLLNDACAKFLSTDPQSRKESLERLWDAWERLKSLEMPRNKSVSVGMLLDRAAAQPAFREVLEREALELTKIGNSFSIRHSEVGQIPLERPEHMDYLFFRLFALIHLLLKTSGRL